METYDTCVKRINNIFKSIDELVDDEDAESRYKYIMLRYFYIRFAIASNKFNIDIEPLRNAIISSRFYEKHLHTLLEGHFIAYIRMKNSIPIEIELIRHEKHKILNGL